MEFLTEIINVFLHIDKYLGLVIENFGNWSYLILFVIIFIETGVVIMPFLPGDSLVFACGAFAALGHFNPLILFVVMVSASIIGDNVNYAIGKYLGPKIFSKENVKLLNKEHLDKTHKFYEKHGGKTIIFAKFMPIIRTFAPFVAGIGKMSYMKFLMYNITAALCWITTFLFLGYFFGTMPVVQNNFMYVIIAIVLISFAPAVITFIKSKRAKV